MRKKILFVGESWAFNTMEIKGFDHFYMGGYEEANGYMLNALADSFDVEYMSSNRTPAEFPVTMEVLEGYAAVLISDVGANSLLLNPKSFYKYACTTNRLELIKEYVGRGGAFGMIGGYMSFMGFEAKGFYKDSPIEEILPVELMTRDDRRETPQGAIVELGDSVHPVLEGVPKKWPPLLGYNRLIPKQGATVAAWYEKDPIIAMGEYGDGRTLAFASDCSPHWAPPEFCEWEGYKVLWSSLVKWLVKEI